MKKCEICELDRKYTQVMTSGRVVCSGCYLEYYASQCEVNHTGANPQTPQNVSGKVQNNSIKQKERLGSKNANTKLHSIQRGYHTYDIKYVDDK